MPEYDQDPCEVCHRETARTHPSHFDGVHQTCPRCGEFKFSGTGASMNRRNGQDVRVLLSAEVRRSNRAGTVPFLGSDDVSRARTEAIPNVESRARALLDEMLAAQESIADEVDVTDSRFVGASYSKTFDEVVVIVDLLKAQGLVEQTSLPLGLRILGPAHSQTPKADRTLLQSPAGAVGPPCNWDVFLSHASEDKELARELRKELERNDVSVWFDEIQLRLGDSLRGKIEEGIARSNFGVLLLSKSFLRKEWPINELDGLFSREFGRGKVLLPVWVDVAYEDLVDALPIVAGRLAVDAGKGVSQVAQEIILAIRSEA